MFIFIKRSANWRPPSLKKSCPQLFYAPCDLDLQCVFLFRDASMLVTMSFSRKKKTQFILEGGSSSVLFPVLHCSSRSNKTTSDFPPTHANISTDMTRHRTVQVVFGCVFVVADEWNLPQSPFHGSLGRRYYAYERIWDRVCRNWDAYELPCMMWSITTRLGIYQYIYQYICGGFPSSLTSHTTGPVPVLTSACAVDNSAFLIVETSVSRSIDQGPYLELRAPHGIRISIGMGIHIDVDIHINIYMYTFIEPKSTSTSTLK